MLSDDRISLLPLASAQEGTYPRPQLMRERWVDLCGEWDFAFDDDDRGLAEHWETTGRFDRRITVPFPFESALSGVADTSFHPVVWYRTRLATADLAIAAGGDDRVILHFGAVDYRCRVWVNGSYVGEHEGGQSPFSFDISLHTMGETIELVVRAEDDHADVSQPRGKQDWRQQPHSIWYHRTTGIWQPVWVEIVPPVRIEHIHWRSDLPQATVSAEVSFAGSVPSGTRLGVTLHLDGLILASQVTAVHGDSTEITLSVPRQRNGQAYEEILWSPEHPVLIDAALVLDVPQQPDDDVVASYLGLRSAATSSDWFLLNDRPYFLRSVLNQGYWPESHAAAPTTDALRREAQLIKDLGFNATRLHQKYEDPRFLFWADKLGLLVWAEAPSAYTFDRTAVRRTATEWMSIVQRDISHPSIVAWVPLNESWGVQHIAADPRMRSYAKALVHLTKAVDSSRPVISNDGWEHVDSDILSIHDYDADPDSLGERIESREKLLATEYGHAGRRLIVDASQKRDAPIMLTEFGGISYTDHAIDQSWGYSTAKTAAEFERHLSALFTAVNNSTALAGYCYTQLVDTGQETNGLLFDDRRPKLPLASLRNIVLGRNEGAAPSS